MRKLLRIFWAFAAGFVTAAVLGSIIQRWNSGREWALLDCVIYGVQCVFVVYWLLAAYNSTDGPT